MLRAQVVLAAAQGEGNKQIAERLGIAPNTASRWRKRFFQAGLAGLVDRDRSGRPRAFPAPGWRPGRRRFGRVAFYLDLLQQRQGQLEAPHSRCLRGRLYRLEIPGRRRVHRLAYYADGDGTIVLLTVWRRWRGTPPRAETGRDRNPPPKQPNASRTEGREQ